MSSCFIHMQKRKAFKESRPLCTRFTGRQCLLHQLMGIWNEAFLPQVQTKISMTATILVKSWQGDKELVIESSEARSLQAPKLLRSLENMGSKINPASSFSAVNAGQEGIHQAGKCCYGLKAMPSNRKHMLQLTINLKEIPAYAPNFW